MKKIMISILTLFATPKELKGLVLKEEFGYSYIGGGDKIQAKASIAYNDVVYKIKENLHLEIEPELSFGIKKDNIHEMFYNIMANLNTMISYSVNKDTDIKA